jgi:glutaredoxin
VEGEMQPLSVQVITYAPTVFRHCQHCEVAFQGVGLGERIHRAEASDALPADLTAEFQEVSDWVHALLDRHGPRVSVSVIDAASIEGVWKSLRHGVRRYPAVIVDGTEKRIGRDFAELDELVEQRLGRRPAAEKGGG